MIPEELSPFIPDDDDGPPFYFFTKPGSDVSAEAILYWIACRLDEVPNRTQYRWRVWFSEWAYGLVKERFWPWIEMVGWYEWIKIPSPNLIDWEIRLKIAGTEGGVDDMFSDDVIDKVTITLDIDDGTTPGMP